VLHGTVADLFLVTARDARGELAVAAVPSDERVHVEADDCIDGTRTTATVHFDAAPATLLSGGDAASSVALTLDRLRTALALDAVGAADRALELSVEYAKVRVAFDRPIGSFQAVQHLCADMLRAVELARTAAHHASAALDHAPAAEAHLATVQAAAYACEELPRLGANAIQVFGGIGYTWEHDIHLFYKRLLSAGALLGTADDHLAELADLVLGPSAPGQSAPGQSA
jgi:alkylation response protein AidB-like acyl-CoA dehydrogenase